MKTPLLLCSALLISQGIHASYDQYQKYIVSSLFVTGAAYSLYSSLREYHRLSHRTAQEVLDEAEAFILKTESLSKDELSYPDIRNHFLMDVRTHIYWINQRIVREEIACAKAADCFKRLTLLHAQLEAIKPFLTQKFTSGKYTFKTI